MLKNKLPNSRNCFACGMENPIGLKLEFYADPDTEGGVVGEYSVPKVYEGYPGLVHGGVISTIMDEAVSRVFMLKDHNRFMYTARLTTKYRKHVPVEQPLRITGVAVKDRGRVAEAHTAIYDASGELLAEGEALMVALPPGDLEGVVLEELGWRVYPDTE
ncbi:MAG: PaaI family thioesterase [Anaerolineales bacterium]|nr:PaaI family thioesterase [Anaerolineales bacterium]